MWDMFSLKCLRQPRRDVKETAGCVGPELKEEELGTHILGLDSVLMAFEAEEADKLLRGEGAVRRKDSLQLSSEKLPTDNKLSL